jgi:FAD/FMN-containing dehydrogenase
MNPATHPTSRPPAAARAMLSGWGRYPAAECEVFRPEKISELREIVASDTTSLTPRGAGRAYGDAAVNAGNRVVDIQRMSRMLAFDQSTGILRAEAGVTLAEVIDVFLRRGFLPPVTPGTRFVTLGGSIAADVHGKNHHRASSIGAHVTSFVLMLASGEIRRCSREENGDLFRATIGGMGLTGVILEIEIRLQAVPSAYFLGEVIRTANIDETFEAFERTDAEYGYSMAWIDCASTGSALGRCVFFVGNHAHCEELPPAIAQDPYNIGVRPKIAVPFDLPAFALNPYTVRAFNALVLGTHPTRRPAIFNYDSFFYPLDSIHNWNRIYGRRGFVQYQCVWPLAESRAGLIETIEAIAKSRRGSFLTVLKRFGAQEGMMSFPIPGYTLALDFSVEDGLFEFLDTLDEKVIRRGGRVYLAKDARMKPEAARAMYSDLPRWQAIRSSVDPTGRFSSSLSRRLKMDPT